MADTHIFELAHIIRDAGKDPAEVAEAIFAAGYRRPPRTAAEEVALALRLIKDADGADSLECIPESMEGIHIWELNELVDQEMWDESKTESQIARELLTVHGYSKSGGVREAFELLRDASSINAAQVDEEIKARNSSEVSACPANDD
jgi:hypothetical protein